MLSLARELENRSLPQEVLQIFHAFQLLMLTFIRRQYLSQPLSRYDYVHIHTAQKVLFIRYNTVFEAVTLRSWPPIFLEMRRLTIAVDEAEDTTLRKASLVAHSRKSCTDFLELLTSRFLNRHRLGLIVRTNEPDALRFPRRMYARARRILDSPLV